MKGQIGKLRPDSDALGPRRSYKIVVLSIVMTDAIFYAYMVM